MAFTPESFKPECTASPSTSIWKNTHPICAAINSRLVGSHTTTASALTPLIAAHKEPFPPPSSSHTEATFTVMGSEIPASFNNSNDITDAIRPAFISATPNPVIRFSITCGFNGGIVQCSSFSAGMWSICPLNNNVFLLSPGNVPYKLYLFV